MAAEQTNTKEKRKQKKKQVLLALVLGMSLVGCPGSMAAADESGMEAVKAEGQVQIFSDGEITDAESAGAISAGEKLDVTADSDQGPEISPAPVPTQSPEISPSPEPTQAPQRIYVVIENPEKSPFSDGTQEKDDGTGENGGDSGTENISGTAESVQTSGNSAQTEEIIRQPKMLLVDTGLSGKKLEAGTTETFSVSFTNSSVSQSAYNLKITVASDSESVLFQKNSYYISRVSPGETRTLELTASLAADAKAGSLPLTFTFEYEDKKGNALTGTEKLTLLAAQSSSAELAEPDFPTVVYASDTLELTLGARNTGRTAIYNARITLDGEGMSPTGEIYLGSLEAGASGSGTMRIYVGSGTVGTGTETEDGSEIQNASDTEQKQSGAVTGIITLCYEDADGKTHEVTKEYQTEIKAAKVLSLKVSEEEPAANSWWISVCAVVIAGLGGITLILLWRLRRKNLLLKEARGNL